MSELRKIRSLLVIAAFVHPDHDSGITRQFAAALHRDGWLVTDKYLSFPDYGDSVAGAITFIVCIHKSTAPGAKKVELLTPPQVAPRH